MINELLYSVGDGGGGGRSSTAAGPSPPAGDGMLVFNRSHIVCLLLLLFACG